MTSKIKTLLSVLIVALLLVAGTIATTYVFENQKKVEKPFAQVAGDEEEEEEECPPEECGGVNDSESDEDEEPAPSDEPDEPATPACSADTWSCGDWAACSLEGKQTRSCKLTNDCATAKTPSPATSQACEAPKPACEKDLWNCGSWSACSEAGAQERSCSLKDDCESAETPKPATKQACEPPKPSAPVIQPSRPAAEEKPASAPAPVQAPVPAPVQAPAPAEAITPEAEKVAASAEIAIQEKVEKQIQERKNEIADFTKEIEQTPAFQKLLEASPPSAIVAAAVQDVNANGVPDSLDRLAGIDPEKADQELVRQEAALAVQKETLVKSGRKSREEADTIIQKELKRVRTEHKVKTVREVAEKVYNRKIKDHRQDSNNDGVSDEAAVLMGLDPNKRVNDNASFSDGEKLLYGIDDTVAIGEGEGWKPKGKDNVAIGEGEGWRPKGKDNVAIGEGEGWMPRQRVAAGILPGSKFSSAGFTVLAAGPAGGELELVATDKNGRASVLGRRTVSANNKVAFVVGGNQVREGNYVMQVRQAVPGGRAGRVSVIAAANSEQAPASSPAVPVKVVAQSELSEPIIKNIQDVEVTGIKDIRVTTDARGRIKVTGSAEIDATVIGTFESAVYTAAILADVTTGQFEVTSPKQLENGAHDVVIYASRTEAGVQSKPVQLAFTVIEEKATGAVKVAQKGAAQEKKEFPLIPVAAGIGIAALLAVAFILKRKKT